MSYLQSITRLSQADNLGGILTIQVARAADISSIPDPVDGVVYGDIEFSQNGFVTWEVTGESARATSQSRQSQEGTSKGNRLPFMVPKDRADLRIMFEQAEEDELVVVYKDANGKTRIFGTLDAPVRFRFDHDSGGSHADLNHYQCEFYYNGPNNMYEYNGSVSTAPAGPAPSVVRWKATGSPGAGDVIATLQPGETLTIESDFGYQDFHVSSTS